MLRPYLRSVVPMGLAGGSDGFPAINRWAILIRPLRGKEVPVEPMARKPKSKPAKRKPARSRWWSSLDHQWRRRIVRGVGTVLLVLSLMGASAIARARLDQHVHKMVADRADPTLAFVDLPDQLVNLAGGELYDSLGDVLTRSDWLEQGVCRELVRRLEEVGWVAEVNYVRRTSDARFEVSCRYRFPAAMVQQEDEFFLVDGAGVRLPGTYLYNPAWQLIQGVEVSAPPAGAPWPGADLHAGLRILEAVRLESFAHQITAALVSNFDGRVDPLLAHIQLATDRAGGRISWGSPPGQELEENSVAQKLAILRENYGRTGRVDADYPVIDISTLPGRFLVPE